jgi:amino acid transporter
LLVPGLGGRIGEGIVLVAAFAFWSVVNLRGVTLGSRLNATATVAKLLPLLIVAIGGAFFVRPENLAWSSAPAPAEVARTSLLLIFAFAGIEVALVPSGEVRDTPRTVPRAIALAMLGITALYIALQVVSQGVLGNALATASASPLADVAAACFGPWGRTLLLAGASISMFGYLGGVTLSMPRMLYAFARDGFLPRALASVHPVHRSPQAAIAIQAVVTLALAVTGTFEGLAMLANVAALALYFGCALAAWRLRSAGISTEGGAGFRVPYGNAVSILACVVIAWLLTGLAPGEWLAFAACIVVGTILYAATGRRRAERMRPGLEEV